MTLVPTTKGNTMTSMDNCDRQGRTANIDTTYCAFQVGQHVVLVDDHFDKRPGERTKWVRRGIRFPEMNTVYTIRRVFISPRGSAALLLAEIRNPMVPTRAGLMEAYFVAARFRPLKKLRVEDFMQQRAPAPEKREGVSA